MKLTTFLKIAIATPLFAISIAHGQSANDGTLTLGMMLVGVDANNKPYTYIDDGKMVGFDVDLLRSVAKEMNLKIDFRVQDFSGLLPAVVNRQVDVAAGCIGITNSRSKMVDFSEPYLLGILSLATLPGSPITSEIESVKGRRIGVVQGTIEDTLSDQFAPGAEIVRFPNVNAGFLSMRSKYIDGYLIDKSQTDALVQKYPKIGLVSAIDLTANTLIAGYPMQKGNEAFKAKFNAALKTVARNGIWQLLYEKYFPTYPVSKALPTDLKH
ncbi:amino acid ABC transporter substrate-binding protein, PAAT family (TC 3.A.1.3.-) [Collimonas sp. OK607]|uniref:ABC transporter substrate-binding protein n=1 Tax=Collimonas sp. OK607 TaxID=1798194 RepID=UPI0008F35370|nr:ABC transporter substrate-binding protein [Collimonas sp. OK607]SFB35249.1 amino acid ABC transporter substrate-binding protein, PAAT family (TC 3.A.1.3.-) [Collimonas sp. OK607]